MPLRVAGGCLLGIGPSGRDSHVCNLKLFSDNHQIILINNIKSSHCLKRWRFLWSPHCAVISHRPQIHRCDFPPPTVTLLVHFSFMFF